MTSDMRKLYAVSKLLGTAEAIAASGLLSAELEGQLREHIVDTCNAFGVPTIAERPVVQVGDHDPEYKRNLDTVAEIVGAPQFDGAAS